MLPYLNFFLTLWLGIKRKGQQESPDKEQTNVQTYIDSNAKILGKSYFRDPEVNLGFYSKKREGVADVDPKVTAALTLSVIGHGTLRSNPRQASKESSHRQTAQALCLARR